MPDVHWKALRGLRTVRAVSPRARRALAQSQQALRQNHRLICGALNGDRTGARTMSGSISNLYQSWEVAD